MKSKKALIIAGLVLATLAVPYITIPALVLWWFYKTPKLNNSAKKIATGVVSGLIIIGVVSGFVAYSNDTEPSLKVTEPTSNISTKAKEIIIKGTFEPSDRKVWVNGNRIVTSNGYFETTYQLKNGENNIEVSAGDWKRTKVLITVNRELSESEKETKNTPTISPASTTKKQVESTEKQIENKIRASLRSKTNNNLNKFVEVRVNKSFAEDSEGMYVVTAIINADENLTEDLMKKGIWLDMSMIYITSFRELKNVSQVTVIANAILVDKYGKENNLPVLKTMLVKSEADKVNWNADESTLSLQILPQVWESQIDRF